MALLQFRVVPFDLSFFILFATTGVLVITEREDQDIVLKILYCMYHEPEFTLLVQLVP